MRQRNSVVPYIGRTLVAHAVKLATLAIIASPGLSVAQAQDLSSVIRASILSDPRAPSLSQQQVDAVVQDLTSAAVAQGVSEHDILWHPDTFEALSRDNATAISDVCSQSDLLCHINAAFGFSGNDRIIPTWLGISSAALILIIAGMVELQRIRHSVDVVA